MIKWLEGDARQAASFIARQLESRLSRGRRVLWLVPGGSAAAVARQVLASLPPLADGQLVVTLTDERYGPPGHGDSNWLELGDWPLKRTDISWQPVLIGAPLDKTTQVFNDWLARAIRSSHYRLGLFGIGSDGHTAGLLPGSLALRSRQLACGYHDQPDRSAPLTADGVKRGVPRLTITPAATTYLDLAVVYARGQNKQKQLDRLKTAVSLSSQPAQALKSAAQLVIFNDREGTA